MQQFSLDPYVMIAEEVYDVVLRIESNLKKNIFNNSYSIILNIFNKRICVYIIYIYGLPWWLSW